MKTDSILSAIDAEVARLHEARALLAGPSTTETMTSAKGSAPKRRRKRAMSPGTRRRIAEGQRKRWAAQKKAAKWIL